MTPEDVGRCTVEDFDLLVRWLDQYERQMKEASRG